MTSYNIEFARRRVCKLTIIAVLRGVNPYIRRGNELIARNSRA